MPVGRHDQRCIARLARAVYSRLDQYMDDLGAAIADCGGANPNAAALLQRCGVDVPPRSEWDRWAGRAWFAHEHGARWLADSKLQAACRLGLVRSIVWPVPVARTWYWRPHLEQQDLEMLLDASTAIGIFKGDR